MTANTSTGSIGPVCLLGPGPFWSGLCPSQKHIHHIAQAPAFYSNIYKSLFAGKPNNFQITDMADLRICYQIQCFNSAFHLLWEDFLGYLDSEILTTLSQTKFLLFLFGTRGIIIPQSQKNCFITHQDHVLWRAESSEHLGVDWQQVMQLLLALCILQNRNYREKGSWSH